MKAFYCVGTHWDREWYKPFQEFRMWLVELIDELIELMERDPAYCSFHLDGQTIVIEDYLEIRPENRERLLKLIREKRLLIGPWYNLPDEWLISGESYVRNLMRGHRICRELGAPKLDFAYTPDQFGHIAALPMIMRGFGLSAGICWRGTQDAHYPTQFVWVGPDGSRMVYHKLLDRGSYGVFDFLVRGPVSRAGFTVEALREHFDAYLKVEMERAPLPYLLMLDATDHQRPDPEMPRLMAMLREQYPDIEFEWGSLEEYGKLIAKHIDHLPERTGELREPVLDVAGLYQYLIVHVISSRYPVKKRNDQCAAMLEKWAEPYALFQKLAGGAPILRYLDKAWEYLLKNHPHDSICGCSVDQVHRDMRYRFDQSELIADGVVRRAIASVAQASDAPEAWKNIVVHNPLPFARHGVFDLALEFPSDYDKHFLDGLCTGQKLNKFHLVGPDGARLNWQYRGIERQRATHRLNSIGRVTTHTNDVCHVAVELDVPACGYTAFRIEATDDATRNFGSQLDEVLSASNGLIGVSVYSDGTACLVNEQTARVFDNLFVYDDSGDAGDGWTRGPLVKDVVYRSPGSMVSTAIDEDGPLRTVFRIEREFALPAQTNLKTHVRADAATVLRVTDFLCVEKGAACLKVRTVLHNTVRDHRFRVLFPTYAQSDRSFSETPFAVVERDVKIPVESAHWQERINAEKAFTSFFGVQDEDGGLAVLAPFGLHEYEVLQTPDRSLALTLFRATWQTVMTNGEPDGELLEEMVFEYQIWPFAGAFDAAEAARMVAAQQAGVRAHTAADLPEPRSFLHLEPGKAVVTALKPAADCEGGIIRLWNPGDVPRDETIYVSGGVEEASLCDLNERVLSPLIVSGDGGIPVTVAPRGLTTVLFTCRCS